MQKDLKMIQFKKVNCLEAVEITNKYADFGPKPYYKLYAYGALIDEVPFTEDQDALKKNLKDKVDLYERQMQ